jgi:predicted HNH restriction endonuclease
LITLTWHTRDARGCRDALPPSWFEQEGSFSSLRHDTFSRDGDQIAAYCSVTVKGKHAWLDYGTAPNASLNKANEVFLDHLLLTFEDADRSNLLTVEFLEDGQPTSAAVTIENTADISAAEGNARLIRHLHRERDSSLRRHKIEEVLARTGRLDCEACGFNANTAYAGLENVCEVHHRIEIAEGPRRTALSDLAILCANCHGAIHRLSPMPSVEEFGPTHVRFHFQS